MDENVNPIFQCSLAEYAWWKVHQGKRLIKRHGLKDALADVWCFELLHLHREHHVPQGVREDYDFLAQEMSRVLESRPRGLGCQFTEGVSDAEIEVLGSAFWRIYDATKMWYSRFNRAEVELLTADDRPPSVSGPHRLCALC